MYFIKRAYVKPRFDPKHHKSIETCEQYQKNPSQVFKWEDTRGFFVAIVLTWIVWFDCLRQVLMQHWLASNSLCTQR